MRRSAVSMLTSAALVAAALTVAAPARAATVVVHPSDDASVEERSPSTNLDGEATLRADDSPLTHTLLGFTVGSLDGPVTRARLRLWVVNRSGNGPEVWTSGDFDEGTVTWDSRPSTGTRLADAGSISAGGWLELDVTAAVTGPGRHVFALVPDSTDGSDFSSEEAASNRPELVVETAGGSSASTTTSTTAAAGAPPATSGGTFLAVADTYVEEDDPADNFGAATTLEADGSPVRRGLLAFAVPPLDGSVTRARLRVWVTNSSGDGPEVWRTGGFDEGTVTWSSAPPLSGSVLADAGRVSSGGWAEWDVTAAVSDAGGVHVFALVADSTDGMDYTSREGSSSQRPQLVVDTGDSGSGGSEPPPPPPGTGDAFQVGLIGDTGYTSAQEEALLDTRDDMDRFPLAFVVHAGDIWGGGRSCSDSRYGEVHDVFDGFEAPLVYTPGDNEWEDCSSGDEDDHLDTIRDIFFPTDETLGRNPMVVERQTPTYVENARWVHQGVVFATVNEPGSSGSSGSLEDANVDWLHETFDRAEDSGAPAVMVIWQDNPFSPSGGDLYRELRDRTVDFGRPVVLVHGDTHNHRVDQPWSDAPNFTRVEVFGTSDSGEWVRATIDPQHPDVFSFSTERP